MKSKKVNLYRILKTFENKISLVSIILKFLSKIKSQFSEKHEDVPPPLGLQTRCSIDVDQLIDCGFLSPLPDDLIVLEGSDDKSKSDQYKSTQTIKS